MTTNGEAAQQLGIPATGPDEVVSQAVPTPTPTLTEILTNQANRVAALANRVAVLLDSTKDAFNQFLVESELFYQTLKYSVEGPHDDSSPNSANTQASA